MSSPLPDMREAALDLAKRFPVFPLWPVLPALHRAGSICGCGKADCPNGGKHPIGHLAPHGVKDATQDPKRVDWFWRARSDANIGIATGRNATGRELVVVDIDPRHGGKQSIRALEKKHGSLPETLIACTGGGGWHPYFLGELPNSTGKLGVGLDIRGTGGYVVAPPSLHKSGNRYAWCGDPNTPIAPLPQWIADELMPKQCNQQCKQATPSEEWRELVGSVLSEGNRNNSIARLVGHLLRKYVDPIVVLILMRDFNACHCQPPLDDEEFNKIINSIYGRELRRRENQ